MNKKFTALLMALLLALTLCVPAMASAEYGSIFDETEELGSAELTYQGEQELPQLAKTLGIDLRVDVFTDEGLEPDDTVSDIATYVYDNYDYGLGEDREGVSLTLLMKTQPDGSYALAEDDWCVYAFLSETRGSSQELSDAVYAAIKPYMAAQAWNGEDMTMSATALSQAVDAMMKAASDYILANCPPDNSGEVTETQTPEQTGVDMKYIFSSITATCSPLMNGRSLRRGRRTFPSATAAAFMLPSWTISRSTETETTYIKRPISSITPMSSAWVRTVTALSFC